MGKGITDLIVIIVIAIFFIGIVTILADYLNDEIKAGFEETGVDGSSFDYSEQGIQTFNFGSLFIVIGLGIAIIGGAWYLRTNPMMAILVIVLLGLFIMISVPFSNAFNDFRSESQFADSVDKFPILIFVISNIRMFLLGIGIIIIIALFGKKYAEG